MTRALLERVVELTAIEELTGLARDGRGGLLVIEGPAGIGKTSLLDSAREAGAQAGVAVLGACGSELESGFAYGIVRQLFERALRRLNPAGRRTVLGDVAALAGSMLDSGAMLAADASADAAFALRHSLYWLVVNLAGLRPLLIVVDDAHWADRASLHWLHYLGRRVERTPIGVLIASRPVEPGAHTELVAALTSEPGARILRPAELSADAVTQIINERLGVEASAPFAAACRQMSGGNPLMLTELVRELAEEGVRGSPEEAARLQVVAPQALGHAVLARVARLPREAVAVVKAVAVLGHAADPTRVAALTGLRQSSVRDAIRALVALDVLSARDGLVFAHPMLQAAVYDDMEVSERADLHARAARVLIDSGSPPEEVAAHLLHTDPSGDPVLVEVLREAAGHALAQGEADAALPYLRRAWEEMPTEHRAADLQTELARILVACGEESGIELLSATLRAAREPRERAVIALELGRALGATNRLHDATEVVLGAVEALDGSDLELELLLEATLHHAALNATVADPSVKRRIDRFAGSLNGDTPGERAMLVQLAGDSLLAGASAEQAIALMRPALARHQPLDDHERMLTAAIAGFLVFCEELETARGLLDELLCDARTRGSPLGFVYTCSMRCMTARRRGEIPEALADGASACEVAEEHGIRLQLGMALANFADALVQHGEPERALSITERYFELEDQRNVADRGHVLHTRAQARLAFGQVAEAIDELHQVREVTADWGVDIPTLSPWRSTLANAMRLTGDMYAARSLAREEVVLARRFGAPRALGIALLGQASCEPAKPALEVLHEAASVLEGSYARLEYARSLLALGAALRRSNQRSAARDRLLLALDLAHRCGSPPLQSTVREELAALGTRPRRPAVSGREALTASEARVAAMAAEGMSNKQIAQALFVTYKTVETHLSRTYTKLGISSRRELATALQANSPTQTKKTRATP